MTPLVVRNIEKSFTMHLRDGVVLPVVSKVGFEVAAGECVVLGGPSGAGKSSLLKMVYGNYGADAGEILVLHHGKVVDLATAEPRTVIAVRRDTIGYVSQFLRTVPRVSALDVVASRWWSAAWTSRKRSSGLARCWPGSTCRSGCGGCRRRRFRAASSSGSTSPAASAPNTRYCCSTSRPPRSMPPTAP